MINANSVRATFEHLESRGYETVPVGGSIGYTAFLIKRFDNGAKVIMKRENGEYKPFSLTTNHGDRYAENSERATPFDEIPAVTALSDLEDFAEDPNNYNKKAEFRIRAAQDLSSVPGNIGGEYCKISESVNRRVKELLEGNLGF